MTSMRVFSPPTTRSSRKSFGDNAVDGTPPGRGAQSEKKDLAITIAGEIVISARMVEALTQHGITGADYRRVRHKTGKEVELAHWV